MVARQAARLFASTPSVDYEDLLQDCLIRSIEIHREFNPALGKYSAFMTTRLNRYVIDRFRSETASRRRGQGRVVPATVQPKPVDLLIDLGLDVESYERVTPRCRPMARAEAMGLQELVRAVREALVPGTQMRWQFGVVPPRPPVPVVRVSRRIRARQRIAILIHEASGQYAWAF
jgi:DNA-directed RNA polymerase specialized sigma24 family protein